MRTIKQLHKASSEPIADLSTYRALPSRTLQHLDPFLFLNHHGPQFYGPGNHGLPFGPHPHRGFETLTYILQGDIVHKDSATGESVIQAGGIQWMTAGSGLIHSEVSSQEFKKKGGMEEVIQLWINLPSHLKMTPPHYIGLQKEEIPSLSSDDDRVTVNIISGRWDDVQGPVSSLTDIHMASIYMRAGGTFTIDVATERTVLCYIVNGEVSVNTEPTGKHILVEFDNDEEEISMRAIEDSVIIFGHGKPFNEPIVAYGPFVMNSPDEIRQAIADYQAGKMGAPEL
jgi:redox-sensitive bicupin YhaK (pirin superfamily)